MSANIKYDNKRWEKDNFEYYKDIWGNTWHRIIGLSAKGEIYKQAIQDWSDLDSLSFPNLAKPEAYEFVQKISEDETEKFRLGFMSGWVFDTARYLRSMDQYFMDLVLERERIDILHERICDALEAQIHCYGKAGVDGIMFCEDLGIQDRTLIGPDMWLDVFRPHYERLTSAAHSHGMKVIQHSCGYNWVLVDHLCEAGIDCLQFDQPAVYDQPALAEKLRKHKVGLFSPCDIQKVLPTGDREYIENETERLVNNFRGGFIAGFYGDLHGIGVKPEWDEWSYQAFLKAGAPQLVS
jgi:uroporphyrinogen-III decarboxylase